MQNQSPPFRADTVGSLLRSKRLLDARAGKQAGRTSDAELRKIEDEEVLRAVALQKDVGLKCCTDGDFRRRHWFMDFIERIDGLRFAEPMAVRFKSADGSVEFSPPRMELHAPLKRTRSLTGTDFPSLKPVADAAGLMPRRRSRHRRCCISAAPVRPPTARYIPTSSSSTRTSPRCTARRSRRSTPAAAAICRSTRPTSPAICPILALREQWKKDGEDPDALVVRYARLINDSVRDVPDDMTVCVHMCRGNHAGGWFAEGGYDPVAEISFSEIEADGFFLEYDTPRAGSFTPLRHLGKDKIAVLGLVTTKSPKLESKDELKRRIDEASKHVPLERLALSPQCGFASTIEGNPLTEEDEKRKLRLVVETAREVWGF